MSITGLVRKYISTHPYVKECLKKDLINFSSLSRTIASEMSIDAIKNFDAILVAVRRCRETLQSNSSEAEIIKILKLSKIEMKNRIVVLVMQKNVTLPSLFDLEREAKRKSEVFRIIEGSNSVTIITIEDFLPRLKRIARNSVLKETAGLVEITIKSPREIEIMPGIVAYLYSLFGENNINIAETLSCWTDTILVINEDDLSKVMSLLRF